MSALNDLNQMFSIVDPNTGKPTDYLMRLLRDRGQGAQNLEELVAALNQEVNLLEQLVQSINGTQVTAGTGLGGGGIIGTTDPIQLDLLDTTVTPGSYTNTDLTVDAQGRITAAANGSGGGGGGGSYFNGATIVDSTVSTRSFATKGVFLTPKTDISVSHLHALINSTSVIQEFGCEIWDLSSVSINASERVDSATVGSRVASETSTIVTGPVTSARTFSFELDSGPITLTGGQTYLLVIAFVNGSSGTDPCRLFSSSSSDVFNMNLPGVTHNGAAEFNTIRLTSSQTPTNIINGYHAVWLEGTF